MDRRAPLPLQVSYSSCQSQFSTGCGIQGVFSFQTLLSKHSFENIPVYVLMTLYDYPRIQWFCLSLTARLRRIFHNPQIRHFFKLILFLPAQDGCTRHSSLILYMTSTVFGMGYFHVGQWFIDKYKSITFLCTPSHFLCHDSTQRVKTLPHSCGIRVKKTAWATKTNHGLVA